nr:hypothetical protein [Tanacetum cinerariifolium]
MSNRNYIPPESLNPRPHQTSSDLETIQTLLSDNQRLAATHVALKQELTIALQDLHHFSTAASQIKSDRDGEIREVYEKAVRMENEVRLIDEMSGELGVVKSDVGKLCLERKELNEKFEEVGRELAGLSVNKERVSAVRMEIDGLRKEVQRGRAAVDYEKKVYASNIEQGKAMEKSMISLSQEIERLKAELAEADKRANAAAAAAATNALAEADKRAKAAAAAAATNTPGTVYPTGFANHDMSYGANAYAVPSAAHQVQGGVNPQYGSGPVPYAPYDMQHHMVNPQYGGPGFVPNGSGFAPNGPGFALNGPGFAPNGPGFIPNGPYNAQQPNGPYNAQHPNNAQGGGWLKQLAMMR